MRGNAWLSLLRVVSWALMRNLMVAPRAWEHGGGLRNYPRHRRELHKRRKPTGSKRRNRTSLQTDHQLLPKSKKSQASDAKHLSHTNKSLKWHSHDGGEVVSAPISAQYITGVPSSSPSLFDGSLQFRQETKCNVSQDFRATLIFSCLVHSSSLIDLLDPTTPQYRAMKFLTDDDDPGLCPDDPNIVQRFVLAVVYFQMGGDNWTLCGRSDLIACRGLNLTPWMSNRHECQWYGITCDHRFQINEFSLSEYIFCGTILWRRQEWSLG